MLQTTVGSLRQDQLFFEAPVLAQTREGWPGFWEKASLGPGVMAAQRPSQGEPTTTKDAHEPPPRRPARAPVPGTQRTHVGQRPFRDGRVDGAAAAHHPQGGHRPCEPQDRKSTRLNSSHSQISYAVFCLQKKQL